MCVTIIKNISLHFILISLCLSPMSLYLPVCLFVSLSLYIHLSTSQSVVETPFKVCSRISIFRIIFKIDHISIFGYPFIKILNLLMNVDWETSSWFKIFKKDNIWLEIIWSTIFFLFWQHLFNLTTFWIMFKIKFWEEKWLMESYDQHRNFIQVNKIINHFDW